MTCFLDMHTHILPRFDDGSQSSAESIKMLEALFAQGALGVVFTPHFYARKDEPRDFLCMREGTASYFVSKVKGESDSGDKKFPKMYLGAEVEYFSAMSICRELDDMCIGGTKYLLCEMPFDKWTSAMIDELRIIKKKRGITPIIAHIERYFSFFKPRMLDEMIAEGFVIQSNAEAFIEYRNRAKVLKLLAEGRIHLLGSDCHNMEKRAPNMDKAFEVIEKKLGAKTVEELCDKSFEILKNAVPIYEG